MKPLLISMMQGLGDAVYQRPFVRAQSQVRPVYVDSCWPEIYADLRVELVRPRPRFRTQAKNLARLASYPWATPPRDVEKAQFVYSLQKPGTICDELERHVGLAGRPFVFDLPDFGPPPCSPPYAVIRPVSARREWLNLARNPDPLHVSEAAQLLKDEGYTVVCVADLAPGAEMLVGEMPQADVYWVAGELEQPALFALIRHASVVVGGIGWIVPTSLAYRTPAVIVCGGQGQHNAPTRVVDPRIDRSRVRFLKPEPYCMCRAPSHRCRKQIPDFGDRFRKAVLEVAA